MDDPAHVFIVWIGQENYPLEWEIPGLPSVLNVFPDFNLLGSFFFQRWSFGLWALGIQGHLAVPSALHMALKTPGKLPYFSQGQSGDGTMSQSWKAKFSDTRMVWRQLWSWLWSSTFSFTPFTSRRVLRNGISMQGRGEHGELVEPSVDLSSCKFWTVFRYVSKHFS